MVNVPVAGSRADSTEVYAYVVRNGGVVAGDPSVAETLGLPTAAVADCMAHLVALRLLREDDTADHGVRRLVAVSPEVASASLVSPIDEEIHRRRAEISSIQGELNVFRPHYEQISAAGRGVDEVHDITELAGHLHLAAGRCRLEFMGFGSDRWFGLERAASMQDQGVKVRLLLKHSLRGDLRARARLKEITEAGGEVRTAGRLPRQLMIFDDETAFLLRDEHPDDVGPVGVVITNPTAVRLLHGVAEAAWDGAQPYMPAEIGYQEVADDLRQTVVELLAEGLTDEAIARRLGMAVRTCRRHIAAVLRSLDSASRFQAGVQATATGMIDPRRVRGSMREMKVRAG